MVAQRSPQSTDQQVRHFHPILSAAAEYVLIVALAAAPLAAQPPRVTPSTSGRPEPIEAPAWVYPLVASPGKRPDSIAPRHVPGSRMTFTAARALDPFDVADWFPASHPAMPPSVARGRRPAVLACAFCHLADGGGRPENAELAGLPVDYMVQQVRAMRDGKRDLPWPGRGRPMDAMRHIASAATEDEIVEAARYFASLRPHRRARVVETARIPRVQGAVGLYFLVPTGGTEILGERLVEVPLSAQRHELHDPHVPYVAYAPLGSIRRGRTIAMRGLPPLTTPCVSCHGDGLRGTAQGPPLAGRSPSHLLRQLIAFSTGTRGDSAATPMSAVARSLSVERMIAVAAYAGALEP
jgi:cytochrome c553